MDKIFKCDCRTHLVQFEYTGAGEDDFDFEDFSIVIYDVYNPDTGRRYKNPKPLGDVCLLNSAFPKELEEFFNFMKSVLKNRKKPKTKYEYREIKDYDLEKSIKRIEELDRKREEKFKEEQKRRKNEKKLRKL